LFQDAAKFVKNSSTYLLNLQTEKGILYWDMGMHYHKLGYPAYGTAFPHTGAHQHMKMHFQVLGYPSIWECTLSPMGDPRSMYTPQWGLPIGEYMLPILPNGDYQLGRLNSPMGSFRGGNAYTPHWTPNEDSQ
jgi:hypothetical protein